VKVLVVGGGGSEHALVWKLSRSRHVSNIYCSPGNAGISELAECIDVSPDNVGALVDFVKYEWIDVTVLCAPTVFARHVVAALEREGRKVFGICESAFPLALSREAAKNFIKRHRIPSVEYRVFSSYLLAQDYVQLKGLPLVIESDRRSGDRGVFFATTFEEARDVLKYIVEESPRGGSGDRIIVGEHVDGQRMSLAMVVDEKFVFPLASVYKWRAVTGPRVLREVTVTGACSPVPFIGKAETDALLENVAYPILRGLAAEGITFRGLLSADLVFRGGDIRLLDVHLGCAPLEAQTIMPGLPGDIGDIILASLEGKLSHLKMREDGRSVVCVALFSKDSGPRAEGGLHIEGLDAIRATENVFVFHHNTVFEDRRVMTRGGDVLSVAAIGSDPLQAAKKAYQAIGNIHFDGIYYSNDVGYNIPQERRPV